MLVPTCLSYQNTTYPVILISSYNKRKKSICSFPKTLATYLTNKTQTDQWTPTHHTRFTHIQLNCLHVNMHWTCKKTEFKLLNLCNPGVQGKSLFRKPPTNRQTYILDSFDAAPPVTFATRRLVSSVFSSSSCFSSSFLSFVRSSEHLTLPFT